MTTPSRRADNLGRAWHQKSAGATMRGQFVTDEELAEEVRKLIELIRQILQGGPINECV
jgi:hypothetical protein